MTEEIANYLVGKMAVVLPYLLPIFMLTFSVRVWALFVRRMVGDYEREPVRASVPVLKPVKLVAVSELKPCKCVWEES